MSTIVVPQPAVQRTVVVEVPGQRGPAGEPRIVDTVAALRGLSAARSAELGNVLAAGYYAPGDGGGGLFSWSAGSTATDDGGAVINPAGNAGAGRWLADFGGEVDVKRYGARGNASSNDRAAIIAADAYAAARGWVVVFPAGQYVSTNGIRKLAKKWRGLGAPVLAPFPQRGDDKEFLRPGYKHLLPGSSILFTGTGALSLSTQRNDMYSTFTYGVTCDVMGGAIEGMAIVLDVDILDAGGTLTAFGSDNTADYDVGYYIDNAGWTYHRDFVVFGYWQVGGTVVRTEAESGVSNPDYNQFHYGSTMGRRGLSIIGSQSNDGEDAGLSGTQTYGFGIYAMDHHSRSSTSYADASTWRCIYIDGYTDGTDRDINGHYFFGGVVRSLCRHPLELDHATSAAFTQTVFEIPNGSVVGQNDTKEFLATANTSEVYFNFCRLNDDPIYHAGFAGAMAGRLICIGQPHDGICVTKAEGGEFYTVRLGGSGATADPAIQLLSGSPSSSTAGWSIRRDVDGADVLDMRWDGTSVNKMYTDGSTAKLATNLGPTRTISGGAITVSTHTYYPVDTEASASTDDLDTINGGTDGHVLILRAFSQSRDIVLKDQTGNLRLASDFTLTHSQDRIALQYDGTNWIELFRSDNTV